MARQRNGWRGRDPAREAMQQRGCSSDQGRSRKPRRRRPARRSWRARQKAASRRERPIARAKRKGAGAKGAGARGQVQRGQVQGHRCKHTGTRASQKGPRHQTRLSAHASPIAGTRVIGTRQPPSGRSRVGQGVTLPPDLAAKPALTRARPVPGTASRTLPWRTGSALRHR